MSVKQATPSADVRRWTAWLDQRVPRRTYASLSRSLGKHHSYFQNMEEQGCIPPPNTVRDIARLLDANEAEALAHAGYAPLELNPDQWAAILCDLQLDRLQPELRAALRGLQGLSAGEIAAADDMLVGLARGFTMGRERRRRAS